MAYLKAPVNQPDAAFLLTVFRKMLGRFLHNFPCLETITQLLFQPIHGYQFLNQTFNNEH
jgi:hypothetical protein